MGENNIIKNESQHSVTFEKNSRGYNFSFKVYGFNINEIKTKVTELKEYCEELIKNTGDE